MIAESRKSRKYKRLSDDLKVGSRFRRVRVLWGRYWFFVPLLILVAWTLLPIFWALMASFKSRIEIYVSPKILPNSLRLDAYAEVLSDPLFLRFAFNSMFLAIISTLLAVTISVLAAYAFSRYAFRWRHVLLLVVLVPRILPRAALIVPLYRMMVNLGLLNTYTGLVITYTATAIPIATWVVTGFVGAVPRELEESAIMDGATLWHRLVYIVMPVAWPGIAAILIMSLREAWNEFPFVLAFTNTATMRTLPYQLYLLRESMGIQDWSVIQSFTILSIIPLLIAFVFMQRYVVQGIVSGSVK